MSTYYIANMFCSFTQNEVKKKRYWKVGFRFFGCYFAIANRRLKIRPVNDDRCRNPKDEHIFKKIKHTVYDEQGGVCPMCQQHFVYKDMECHHILPWGRAKDLRLDKRNTMMVCHKCHKEIHCNPYKNIALQEKLADEIGLDLRAFYDKPIETIEDEGEKV